MTGKVILAAARVAMAQPHMQWAADGPEEPNARSEREKEGVTA